jgi:hypothetical protein
MKKILVFLMILMMLSVFHGLTADQVNVTGKWDMTVKSERGERTQQVEFFQEGEKLKVIMQGRMGPSEGKGTLKGDKIEWTISRETPMGKFTMTYKGTVKDDTMKGEAETRRGKMKWSATRNK